MPPLRVQRGAVTAAAMSEASIRAAFAKQADWNRFLGSDFTANVCAALCIILDRSTATGRRVLDWPGDPLADALALRLAGGLNALVREGYLPELAAVYPPRKAPDSGQLADLLAVELADDRLLPWLDTAPQTNEVARAGVLMPGLLTIAAATGLPLRLFELGASAGLNLRLDTYRYRLGGRSFGPAGAAVVLAPAWEGPPPPAAAVRVIERRGVDLAPVDIRAAAARDRLLAYVWPEQRDRVARLEAAIAAFVADPVAVDTGDAATWVEAEVAPAMHAATVVFHSIAWQYFPAVTQDRIAAHLAKMGATATTDAPLAWLRYELDASGSVGAPPTLRLTLWPGDGDRLLAHAHPHGASVRWFG